MEDQVSLGALAGTYYRAYHARRDESRIFTDQLVYDFLSEKERTSMESFFLDALRSYDPALYVSCTDAASALACAMQTMPFPPIALSRSRYAEDSLVERVTLVSRLALS